MNHQTALNKLTDGKVTPDHAVELLSLARKYGNVKITHIWDGPDSWRSEIDLSVSYADPGKYSFAQYGYWVEFRERTLY